MYRLHAFKTGLLNWDKEAAKKARAGAGMFAFLDPSVALMALLGAPLAAGATVGALSSKLTSPADDISNEQKKLVLSELQESLADLQRRQAMAQSEPGNKVTTYNERPLHI